MERKSQIYRESKICKKRNKTVKEHLGRKEKKNGKVVVEIRGTQVVVNKRGH